MHNRAALFAVYTGLAICLGALGAHVLEDYLNNDQLASFETGVLYHLLMGLVLFFSSFIPVIESEKLFQKLLFYGSILFSFSIYILACKPIFGLENVKLIPLAIATPVGGVMMILAWFILAFKLLKK